MKLLKWPNGKESSCNARTARDMCSIPDPMEKDMATPSSVLAWKIHGQRSLVGYNP